MSSALPILIADRDAAVLQSLTFWLQAEGYDVRPFTSGEAMLSCGLPGQAVIIMDHDLGDLTAVEILSRLRDAGKSYPAIVMASKRSASLSAAAATFGFELFEKPLLSDSLLNSINGLAAPSV